MKGPICALIVEDDPLLAAALASRCTAASLQPICCETVGEAMAAAHASALAIVDLGLPPTPHLPDEGLRLIESLVAFHPHLPVIVLTGQDEARSAHAAIARGAFDFLAKPVEGPVLDASLQRALRFANVYRDLAGSGQAPVHVTATECAQGLRAASDAAQEKLIRQVLHACNNRIGEASRRLGLERTRLYYYLEKFGIAPKGNDHDR
ncbi:response regulator [Tepidimonas taiwanensis]|uniref:response regulator n=1 Tax=Tepidimonas taiwanensis TaxID=307486 RepID=UPI0009EB0C11|nr:response regulator [Tepidimonas taiwanensis]